jgi:ATP-dependent DNA helicase PIF1
MNDEQLKVLQKVKSGCNVFLSGAAGTGKTFTIKEIVQWGKPQLNVAVTSSTGTSAITIGGRTVHSYLGIGLAQKDAYQLYMLVQRKYPKTVQKLKDLKILVIDEISMISAELLDKISEYLQHVRRNKAPFGGLQMILCGDMCQLPPVNGEFCFNSEVWKSASFVCIELKRQMRQTNDDLFAKMLNELRFGVCSNETYKVLKGCKNPSFGEIQPTILYSKNVNVDSINEREFLKLSEGGAEMRIYETVYSQNKNSKTWAESLKLPNTVELCIGAQVVLTVNLCVDEGFANGSRGMVTGFTEDGPIVLFKNGEQIIIEPWSFSDENDEAVTNEDKIWACVIPLKLAYAMTIHKSQSMTLDAVIVDLGPSIFEYGQAYVALSRVRDLKSVKVVNISKSSFRTHEDVVKFYKESCA